MSICTKPAEAVCGVVEETIRDIMRGVRMIPEGIDPGEFIIKGGVVPVLPCLDKAPPLTLEGLITRYKEATHAKEADSLRTERTHFTHLLRHLGRDAVVESLNKEKMQAYVDDRAKDVYKWPGKKTDRETIKKEIGTLGVISRWGQDKGHILTLPATDGLRLPKGDEKHPFRSWEECPRAYLRAKTKAEKDEIWESLFLTEDEILAVLIDFRDCKAHPMLAFAAYTGARRSEMCRAEVDDVDLENSRVRIREKKRDRSKNATYRNIPIHPDLKDILGNYLSHHLGGVHLFNGRAHGRLTRVLATKRFRATVKGSKWEVLHGWHLFRHSFASNLARQGVAQAHIDELMGHETEAIRKRYPHLSPQDVSQSFGRLFSRGNSPSR